MHSEGYHTWSVCVSVYLNSRTTGYETAHERLIHYKSSKNTVADFAKTLVFESEKRHLHSWSNPSISGVRIHVYAHVCMCILFMYTHELTHAYV